MNAPVSFPIFSRAITEQVLLRATPPAKTWPDYLADGREWARTKALTHNGGNPSDAQVEDWARAYADTTAPVAVRAAYFAAAKAARDVEFGA